MQAHFAVAEALSLFTSDEWEPMVNTAGKLSGDIPSYKSSRLFKGCIYKGYDTLKVVCPKPSETFAVR